MESTSTIGQILERLITHEFVVFLDLLIFTAHAIGVVAFITLIFQWLKSVKMRDNPALGVSQVTPSRLIGLFLGSTLAWRFGEGISAMGELFYGVDHAYNNMAYSTIVFQTIRDRGPQLTNAYLQSAGMDGVFNDVSIKASFAIVSLFGSYSYLRGVIGITYIGHPQHGGKMTLGQIATHMFFGVVLIFIDRFYDMISATSTAAQNAV